MQIYLLFLYGYIGLSLVNVEGVLNVSNNVEVSSLLAVKANITDPMDHLRDWKLPINEVEGSSIHCNWTGIWCNSKGFVEKLDISNLNLSGQISEHIQGLSNLAFLNISCNDFSSSLPKSLSSLTSLKIVDVSQNNFIGNFPLGLTGEIPEDITLSTSLSFIDVSYNHLEASLPSSILSIPHLQIFVASNNNLQGSIPDQFQDCPSLSVLDLSSNYFSGEILPQSIASCEKLINLNLQNNHFTGEIPRPIASMPNLSVLDLSNNSLVGQIPPDFGSSPTLEMLNLSCNKFEGHVPNNGILVTINPNDLIGNAGLCGGVLAPSSHNFSNDFQLKKLDIHHAIIGFVVGISVLVAIVITVFLVRRLYKRLYLYRSFFKDWFKRENIEWPWRFVAFQRLPFTSVDILACLKESNVIGVGGTGIVYKAETQRSHSVLAVKKLWRTAEPDVETGDDIFVEVNLLGKLRHRNIVRLLGYLHNENDVMILYEYMPNGSLGAALHGKQAGKVLVDWVSRYNIALGVAHGLSYLHHDCHPSVIHSDVKSNNILLDSEFEARIADFGLSRTMLHKNETVSIVAGSYGYIAPEYRYTLKVDEKSDIYSYGVVLLELLTGKMPLDPTFGETIDVVEWVRRKVNNKTSESVLDLDVAGQDKHIQEEMLLVLTIALLCTSKLPKERPSMRDIITMLGEAKAKKEKHLSELGILC